MEFSCYEMSILVDFVIGKLRVFFFFRFGFCAVLARLAAGGAA